MWFAIGQCYKFACQNSPKLNSTQKIHSDLLSLYEQTHWFHCNELISVINSAVIDAGVIRLLADQTSLNLQAKELKNIHALS